MVRRAPIVELFSIGTELVYGQIQDTNSFWMAQQIVQLGGKVRRITQLTDDYAEIRAALEDSIHRGDRSVDYLRRFGSDAGRLDPPGGGRRGRGSPLVVHEEVLTDYMARAKHSHSRAG
ncbi:MAG: hypothetical protein KatS3mg115_1906 [Candidatus Poribacteria bacterium]|nr:MAG: hypothetical protein KatS3mg115_1906 [Candidatus Poribacteria bacterium]